ncbi:hypothetical protein PVOR_25218 [Paenibacillus vortex V453]|uniref:Lipoprotein n=1 Tax=Paenibacillus vortex V453 TaxID=715225 RepID=A0A2R9SPR9_9BACL|nr:hypothetical protein [Paenibacillus vortex]EFU39321.1 hypothetical protein PVOR_25218 [Paenibacillus vortex V453]
MKKLIFLAAAFIIVLSGCSKDDSPAPVSNPIGGGEQVQEPVQQQEPQREAVFKNEDIDQAKKMAQQYVAVITEFHGRKASTTAEIDGLQKEMSEKIKSTISIHKDSRINSESGTRRNEENILDLSASRFQLLLEEAQEVYYPNLNVSQLIIPMNYVMPGKYASSDPHTYKLRFVKSNDNQVQLIYDGFLIGGPNLEKKDQDEVDPYNPEKLKEDLQIQ